MFGVVVAAGTHLETHAILFQKIESQLGVVVVVVVFVVVVVVVVVVNIHASHTQQCCHQILVSEFTKIFLEKTVFKNGTICVINILSKSFFNTIKNYDAN